MRCLSTNSNLRNVDWGASIEKRYASVLACADGVAVVTSPDFIEVKMSPGWTSHDVFDDNPIATYSYLVAQFSSRGMTQLQIGDYGVGWHVYSKPRPLLNRKIMFGWLQPIKRGRGAEKETYRFNLYVESCIPNADLEERFKNAVRLRRSNIATPFTQGTEGCNDYPIHAVSALATSN